MRPPITDTTTKVDLYSKLPSVQVYVLIDQHTHNVRTLRRGETAGRLDVDTRDIGCFVPLPEID